MLRAALPGWSTRTVGGDALRASEHVGQCVACIQATRCHRLDPVELDAQSDLIGVPEQRSIEAAGAAQNGGYMRGWRRLVDHIA